MEVLDENGSRPTRSEVPDETDCRVVQPVPRRQRVEIPREVEAKRKREHLVWEQPSYRLRRVAVEDPEVLLQHLAQRPVRDRVPIRETAAVRARRLRILGADPRPQLTDKPRLAHAGVADERDQMRLALLEDTLVGRLQERQLAVASDERGSASTNPA